MPLDPKYIIQQQGKSFVLYPGLLNLLHEQSGGRFTIRTTLVQVPTEMNGLVAISSAEITIHDEHGVVVRSATEFGDAAPSNVNRMIAAHTIRMATTRAKARAMRDITNVGETALEELGGEETEGPPPARRQSPEVKKASAPIPAAPADVPDKRNAAPAPQLTLLEHYQALAKQAVAEGLADIAELAIDAPDETIRDYGAALLKRLKAARAAGLAPATPPPTPRTNGAPLATAKQIEVITNLAAKAGRHVETDGLTRAQASEVLTELIGSTSDGGR